MKNFTRKHQILLVLFYLYSRNVYGLSLSDTYTYDYDKNHMNKFSLSSNLFSFSVFTKNTKLNSFSYALRPMQGISVYGGAVDIKNMPKGFSSAPSRASTIFPAEISVSKEAHLSSGQSTNVKSAGFEYIRNNIHGLIYRKDSTSAAFLLSYESDPRSIFSFETGFVFGTTLYKRKKETKWFVPPGAYPEGTVLIGGGYTIFSSKHLLAQSTILTSKHPFTSHAGCYSGEITANVIGISLRTEYFRNDRHFIGLEGKTRNLLQKIDYAASFEAAQILPFFDTFLLGLYSYSAQYRQSSIFVDDTYLQGFGYGLKSSNSFVQLNVQRLEHNDVHNTKADLHIVQQRKIPIGGKIDFDHTYHVKKPNDTQEITLTYELYSDIKTLSLTISFSDTHKAEIRTNELSGSVTYSAKSWEAKTSLFWKMQAKELMFSLQIQHSR